VPCLLLLLVALFPRIAIAGLFLLTSFFDRAYHSLLVLLLGFLFLPLTTIVYAWIVNGHRPLDGIYLIALIVAVLFDLGLVGHGEYRRRRRVQ
jgi:hypothetical protein